MTELARRHGPLMFLRLGEVPTVVVSNAEVAALVMKTNDLAFASRPCSATQDIFGCGGRGIAFAPYSDHWRQMRKICVTELLNSKQVRRMDGVRAEEADNLVRSITASTGATVNVSEKVRALSNDVVCRGFSAASLHGRTSTFALVGGFCLVDLFPSSRLVRWLSNGERRMRRSYGRIQRIIAAIINERKATRAAGDGACSTDDEDLLDVLLRLQLEDSLEFPLTKVMPFCLDPRCWTNPEEFKPERFENNTINYNGTYFEFLPFGAGRRQCPGMLFGTSTVNITLAYLLYHFEWMFPVGTDLDMFDMSEKFGLAVSRRHDLQLRATPYGSLKAMGLK